MLQNSLPEYLEQLVDDLSTKIERTPSNHWDATDSMTLTSLTDALAD
ncbi:MAG: hypothetical protein V7L31_32390 [Nostoc sp.]